MRRIITLSLLFIIGLASLGVGATLVRRSQTGPLDVAAPDQTLTSVYLLNGGYPFGHATSLPGDAIDQHMTLTATARTNQPIPGQTPMTTHVTFTEQEMNTLLPQYIPADANIQSIEFHFTATGVTLNATAKTLGLTIDASAAAQLSIQNGAITLDVQEATVAGLRPPQAAINAVMDQVIALIEVALDGALHDHTNGASPTLTAITTAEGTITIAFVIPNPQPE